MAPYTRGFRLFFLCIALLGLLAAWVERSAPRTRKVAEGIEGFDLIFDDPTNKAQFGLFELGYAIKANYEYFTYRGRLYKTVGGGAVLIRPATGSPASYVVRETATSTNKLGQVERSRIQIIDKRSGEELGHRLLVAHTVEDGTGWTGDHAMKFVRQILESQRSPGRPWIAMDYPEVTASVEAAKATDLLAYPAHSRIEGCPSAYRFDKKALRGEGFSFQPGPPIQFVACDSDRILVASGIYAADLNLDLLTVAGNHIGQGYVRLPLPLAAKWAGLSGVKLKTLPIEVTVSANVRPEIALEKIAPYGQIKVKAELKCSEITCATGLR